MHPAKIIEEIATYSAEIKMTNEGLILTNHEDVPNEFVELIQEYKPRLIDYLNGDYSKSQYAIDITINKALLHWCEKETNESIHLWMTNVPDVCDLLYDLTAELAKNGWNDINNAYYPYETERSRQLADELYKSALAYSKKGA